MNEHWADQVAEYLNELEQNVDGRTAEKIAVTCLICIPWLTGVFLILAAPLWWAMSH